MHRSIQLVLIALAVAAFHLPRVAQAAGTPAQVCAGAKLKAIGKAANAHVVCHAKAAQKGIATDSACLGKADAKLADAFSKAEARGGCASEGDAATIEALLDSSVGAFVATLRPVADASRCSASKLKATGKKAKTKLGCHAKAGKQGGTVDPACLAKAEARFMAAFAKAEARPPCLTTGDSAEVEDLVDDLVDGAVAASLTTTTSTTLGPVCGNGQWEPTDGESCDGDQLGGCNPIAGQTGCFPPGDANQCRCCIPPGGQGIYSGVIDQVCCDGEQLLTVGTGPDPTHPLIGCPGCSISSFPECGGDCGPGADCVAVSNGGQDACACMAPPPPPPVIPCDGGSGNPTCDGTCPEGQQCGSDVDLSPVTFSCACFPAGETPCGSAAYPQCGGTCLRNHVCQAIGGGGAGGCGCVDPTVACGGNCTNLEGLGVCPGDLACMISTFPGFPTVCGCVAP